MRQQPLSGREEELLELAKTGCTPVAPDGAAGGFAKNWDELADRLGTTRRTMQEWRKDPRYTADVPKPRADGRHDVAAWSAFIARHNLRPAAG